MDFSLKFKSVDIQYHTVKDSNSNTVLLPLPNKNVIYYHIKDKAQMQMWPRNNVLVDPEVCFPFLPVNSGDSVPQFVVCVGIAILLARDSFDIFWHAILFCH